MNDRLPIFALILVGCALLLACVTYGCREEEQRQEKDAPQSKSEELPDLSSTPDNPPQKESSEEQKRNGGDSSQDEPKSETEPPSGTSGGLKPGKEPLTGGGAASASGTSTPRGKAPKFATAEQAKEFGRQQVARADKAAKAGEVADAYVATLAGWEALQPHCGNSDCKALSDQLLARMEQYGEQLPSSNAEPLIGKPLKIR